LGTQNGIQIEQVGKLKADNKTLVVKGSYSYTGADGKRYRVRYTADELGFHPITELELDIPDIDSGAGRKQAPPATAAPITTKRPFSQSNFINNKYLPPTNTYLPPSNEYLPPTNDITRDLSLPI
jgi:Insect cuticle protein